MATLHEKFDTLIEADIIGLEVPKYIEENTNQNFEFRPYQVEALSRFIYYIDQFNKRLKPSHLLFNMATGSGKTLIMASTMLHLYNKGYRNFIFFVNSTNIIKKTKDNFLNSLSNKYLFDQKIEIDNKEIKIKEVRNFQSTNDDEISILFTTIQGLHTTLQNPQENAITPDDFEKNKVVLLADEAHHINALTKAKNLTKDQEGEKVSWESTVNTIFNQNIENILLEFTATIDLDDPSIAAKYQDKILCRYSLKEFREDKYSKEVQVLAADLDTMDRALNALVLSQYRLKVAQKHRLFVKPTILMKSKTIDESKVFEKVFHAYIRTLSKEQLEPLKGASTGTVIHRAFDYFETEGVSLDNLAIEMKEAFNEDKTISVNSKDDSEEKQLIVNSLEDENNEIRIIFAVDKLNEGWDVLNLFDIVRLYTTRDGKGGKPGKTTMAEAQLIGRGARYCPFSLNGEDRFIRKFDLDIANELRILEELYYHSLQDSRYIGELHNALVETGITASRKVECGLIIKEGFKATDFWKYGQIFVNERRDNSNADIFGLEDAHIGKLFKYRLRTKSIQSINAMDDIVEETGGFETKDKKIRLISLGHYVIRKAIAKSSFYQFNNLKHFFPHLKSIKDFIESEKYLKDIEVEITGKENQIDNLLAIQKLEIAVETLNAIKVDIQSNNYEFVGTKEFKPQKVSTLFKDKVLNITMGEEQERGIGMRETTNADLKLDLRDKDWYIHEENYGTDQEKLLVRFINNCISELQEKYEEVYLLRNEKDFYLYSFEGGRKFEPDFVLFLREKKETELITYQMFIEPKGTHLFEVDSWKEEFLKTIEIEAKIDVKFENRDFKLFGLPFFNKPDKDSEFTPEFKRITEVSL